LKSIEKLLRKMEPQHDSKWAKFHPVWDGFYTFLFTPGETTHKGSHIRDGIDLKRTMFMVVAALIPCLLFGIYNTGHWHYAVENPDLAYMDMFGDKVLYGLMKVLPLVIVSYAVGLGVEFIFCIKNKHAIQEGFLVSGMLIPLIIPADTPLWMVAMATIFAVVLGKEVFGGTGMNIVNIALTARAFLFFGYPTMMSGDKVWMSGITELNL
jgi:Na+-transporting NADH:ubiquinone oxidoreductase subunit B